MAAGTWERHVSAPMQSLEMSSTLSCQGPVSSPGLPIPVALEPMRPPARPLPPFTNVVSRIHDHQGQPADAGSPAQTRDPARACRRLRPRDFLRTP